MATIPLGLAGLCGRAEADVAAQVGPLLARPIAELREAPGAAVLKNIRIKLLLRVDAPPPLGPALVKVFKCDGAWDRLRYAVQRSKGLLELDRAEELLRRGVPTLPPVAAAERRGPLGRLRESRVVIRVRPDCRELGAVLREEKDAAARRALIEAWGRLLRRAHEAGVFQEDVGTNNVIVDAAGALHVIDLERVHLFRGPLSLRYRCGNLLTLLWTTRDATRADARAFLRAYSDGDRAYARALRRRLRHTYDSYIRRTWRRTRKNSLTPNRFIAILNGEAGVRGYLRRRFAEHEPERFTPDGFAPLLREIARGEAPARARVEGRGPAGDAIAAAVRVERFPARPWPLPAPGLDRWVLLNRLLKVRRTTDVPLAFVVRRTGALAREGWLVTLAPEEARATAPRAFAP